MILVGVYFNEVVCQVNHNSLRLSTRILSCAVFWTIICRSQPWYCGLFTSDHLQSGIVHFARSICCYNCNRLVHSGMWLQFIAESWHCFTVYLTDEVKLLRLGAFSHAATDNRREARELIEISSLVKLKWEICSDRLSLIASMKSGRISPLALWIQSLSHAIALARRQRWWLRHCCLLAFSDVRGCSAEPFTWVLCSLYPRLRDSIYMYTPASW